MGSASFTFKQFCIHHDRCAMRVGTDGVLLGAWTEVPESGVVLDVGTGSGLIALMVAQRAPGVSVVGIDIDQPSVEQARENVAASPFAQRVQILHTSLQDYWREAAGHQHVQGIVCNPPFFTESLLPPDARRSAARHADALPFTTLLDAAADLLMPGGFLSVVLPMSSFEEFRLQAIVRHLLPHRVCNVSTSGCRPPKRVLAAFLRSGCREIDASLHPLEATNLSLITNGLRSADYQALTRDFYL